MMSFLLAAGLGLPAVSCPPGVALPPGGETLRFAPAPQSVLVKRFDVRHELNMDSSGVMRDGGAFQSDGLTINISTWLTLTAQDRYLELGEGRGARLTRTYTDLGAGGKLQMRMPDNPQQMEADAVLVSPLRNRSVDFLWVPSEGDWSRCWSKEHMEEEWLAELRGDMDLLALLPPGEVAEGDTWELAGEALRGLLAPGGNHLVTPRTSNVFSRTVELGVGGDLSEVLGEELLGRAVARYAGVRAQDGRRLAVVELVIEGLQSLRDRTELYRTAMPEEERRENAKLLGVLLEYSLDAKGELLWDLDAGHVHALELSGREGFVSSISKEMPLPGGGVTRLDAQATFSGSMELSFAVEPAAAEGR